MGRRICGGFLCAVMLAALTGCVEKKEEPQTSVETQTSQETQPEEDTIVAIAVPYGENQILFVDQDTETPFTAFLPEGSIYSIDGKEIDATGIKAGDLVEITGDGIMLRSYPGQYPGVTKIQVIKEGIVTDTDKYQEIVTQLTSPSISQEPPHGNVEYRTEDGQITAALTRGGYEWCYVAEDGTTAAEVADSEPIWEWKEIIDLRLSEPTEMEVVVSGEPSHISVARYQEADEAKGIKGLAEAVETEKTQEGCRFTGEEGYRYLISAIFENGRVEYGFMTHQ